MSYTKEQIRAMLESNPKAVERAILAIYNRQTVSERQSGETRELNGVGFSGADARYGTYLAKWVSGGKPLTGKFLDQGRKLASKYVGQLADIANGG